MNTNTYKNAIYIDWYVLLYITGIRTYNYTQSVVYIYIYSFLFLRLQGLQVCLRGFPRQGLRARPRRARRRSERGQAGAHGARAEGVGDLHQERAEGASAGGESRWKSSPKSQKAPMNNQNHK